jgi:hypothetical protein
MGPWISSAVQAAVVHPNGEVPLPCISLRSFSNATLLSHQILLDVATLSVICFICVRDMLQRFHINVAKIDLDVAMLYMFC